MKSMLINLRVALVAIVMSIAGAGCGDSGFKIGGTVSGLEGSLVLQNNGEDELTITEDGEFTFASRVDLGAEYDVTLVSAPSNQRCTVENGSGVAEGHVGDIAVSCANKAWTHPSSSTDTIIPEGFAASAPTAAMASNGDAIVVWQQNDGGSWVIAKSERRDGTWTHPTSAADKISPTGQAASASQVAMNDAGDAVVVWRQSNGLNSHIYKSERRDGTWTHPTLADNISPSGQDAHTPHVAMAENGDAIIVWRQSDGTHQQILKSEYRAGSWTHPVDVTDNISPAGGNAYHPRVAMGPSGEALVVWEQNTGAHWQVFKSEHRGGVWAHPASLDDNISPDGSGANEPDVAIGALGDAIIVWHQHDGSNDQIFKSEYRGGAWAHPASLEDNISPDGEQADGARVVIDARGDAIVAWRQSDEDGDDHVFKSEYRDGVWAHPASLAAKISPGPEGGTASPQLAMDAYGNAIIVWDQSDEDNRSRTFVSEHRHGAWAHPSSHSDYISPSDGEAYDPRVAMAANGDAIVVWDQRGPGGGGTGVGMSEYR
jgi:hypothetical protein